MLWTSLWEKTRERLTIEEIKEITRILHSTVHRILIKEFSKKKKSFAKRIPQIFQRILQMGFARKTAPRHSKEEIWTLGTRNHFSRRQRSRSHRSPGDCFLGHLGLGNAGFSAVLAWLGSRTLLYYFPKWRHLSLAGDLNHGKKSSVQQQLHYVTWTTELFTKPSKASWVAKSMVCGQWWLVCWISMFIYVLSTIL